jgi:uracil-DNA glycosylase family 4
LNHGQRPARNRGLRTTRLPVYPSAVNDAVSTLIGFLKSEQRRGVTHVALDDEARLVLRQMLSNRPQAAARSSTPTPEVAHAAASHPSPAQPQPANISPATRIDTGSGSKTERLAALKSLATAWEPAASLGTLRPTMVFSTGNPDARVMMIGEAPGHEEERRGEPFVGPAGRKLDDIIRAMGLDRPEIYLTNLVKFRPSTPGQTTNNRKPSPAEAAACLPILLEEIAIVRPQCIVTLGGAASEALLGLSGPVKGMRGSWHEINGIPARATYHPSYLLQSGANMQVKREVWEDMLAVMEQLEMPVSEKQRGHFLPKA